MTPVSFLCYHFPMRPIFGPALEKLKNISTKSNISWLLCVITAFLITLNIHEYDRNGRLIQHDVNFYYVYLPAFVNHGDLQMRFLDEMPPSERKRYWLIWNDNGKAVSKYTMGTAVLWLPFYTAADTYTRIFNKEIRTGFSKPYRIALCCAALFYLGLGLYFVRKLLLNFFSESITGLCLLILFFGTNLLYYSTTEAGMSHVYSFAMTSIFVYLTFRWHQKPNWRSSLLLGFVYGLILLIRPANAFIIVFFILWPLTNLRQLADWWKSIFSQWKFLLVIALVAFAVIFPQLAYWKLVTDQWIYYSYGSEGFNFSDPQMLNGLFSMRKGWFIYTPIMVFSIVGILWMLRSKRPHVLAILFFLPIHLYIAFSWWSWWYGGSYGQRVLIDILPIMVIPLAWSLYWLSTKTRTIRISAAAFILLLLALNLFQTWQYRSGIMHWDSMTWQAYKAVFLKTDHVKNLPDLIDPPDYPEK